MFEKLFGDAEFLPHRGVINVLRKIVCNHEPLEDLVCENVVFLMSGFDRAQLNKVCGAVIELKILKNITQTAALFFYRQCCR